MSRPPARESVSVETIPIRPVREIATEAITDLDDALARLAAFGVDFSTSSRLHQARRVLAEARDSGRLAPVHRGDTLGLRALETSLDFHDITSTLPKDKDAAIRKDLENAVIGELEPAETARGPLQLQSQLVVRSAFVRGSVELLKPGKPKSGIPVPDLLMTNGLSTYAIEVKRPQSAKSLLARFEEGVDQVRRYGTLGGVIVDVTDCVRELTGEQLNEAIRQHTLDLYDIAWDGHGFRPGYSHLLVIGTLARPAWTSADSSTSALVNVHCSSTVGVLASHRNNLSGHRARWIRTSFQNGLRKLGMTSVET